MGKTVQAIALASCFEVRLVWLANQSCSIAIASRHMQTCMLGLSHIAALFSSSSSSFASGRVAAAGHCAGQPAAGVGGGAGEVAAPPAPQRHPRHRGQGGPCGTGARRGLGGGAGGRQSWWGPRVLQMRGYRSNRTLEGFWRCSCARAFIKAPTTCCTPFPILCPGLPAPRGHHIVRDDAAPDLRRLQGARRPAGLGLLWHAPALPRHPKLHGHAALARGHCGR